MVLQNTVGHVRQCQLETVLYYVQSTTVQQRESHVTGRRFPNKFLLGRELLDRLCGRVVARPFEAASFSFPLGESSGGFITHMLARDDIVVVALNTWKPVLRHWGYAI